MKSWNAIATVTARLMCGLPKLEDAELAEHCPVKLAAAPAAADSVCSFAPQLTYCARKMFSFVWSKTTAQREVSSAHMHGCVVQGLYVPYADLKNESPKSAVPESPTAVAPT
jgi:hypothetical protein